MNWSESREALEAHLAARGRSLAGLRARDLVSLLGDWYRDVRAEGVVPIEEDGDMLLFQWGPLDDCFEIDVTRQFVITGEEDDDAIWQLSTTLKYPLSSTARFLERGDQWCSSPDEVSDFIASVLNGPVLGAFGGAAPRSVEVHLENAG